MMHADNTQPIDTEALESRIERLEDLLARERDARDQAERIAEHGMRDLWQVNRDLERRVAARTAELERSLASANLGAAAKERFLADLGHELSTPLHAVLGLLELIDFSALSADDQRRIEAVHENATTLSELLQGLVELAGATGAPAPGDITTRDASSWVDDVIDAWTRPAARRGQLLVPTVVGGNTPIALDWRRLDKITHAVMLNATRHGDPGPIEIHVAVDEGAVVVCIADSGPGISDDQAATAFEPFVKHGPGGGIGIGLSIAHRLAVGADGEIEMTRDGSSTRIRIALPHGD